VVHEEKLSAVLSDFARTMATDFPIQGILDHLVQRIVDVLPVTAAGVTLIHAGEAPRYIAASNDEAMRYERLQTEIGEGPCLSAYVSGQTVSVPDLRADNRFAQFAPAAVAAGLAAVFTFPLRQASGRLGALDLYRDEPGDLAVDDMVAAQTLADVAAAYLLNAQSRDEARVTTERFRHNALHDPLTGLPNRLLLQQRLEHAALRSRRSRSSAAILFVDIDQFKSVNDSHGHQVGDELLVAVGARLSRLVRPGDTLTRFAGDEFVFLCEDMTHAQDAELLATRIDQSFAEPFVLSEVEIVVAASVGVAFAGPGGEISADLLAEADRAMYQAKRKGGGSHQIIDLREALRTLDRDSLAADLRVAFAHDNLDVAFQPVVRSTDGLMTGVEALLRWTDPLRGQVSPSAVVRVAEQSTLINRIGAWALTRACRARVTWLEQFPHAPLDLAVNVSARQLVAPGFSATVVEVLRETGMDPRALILEMTEDILIEDTELAMRVLRELRELGIRIALDDFGTGFSSLSYLRRLPIDIVKIDQGFIADIGRASEGREIAAAVTNLAHVLGKSVTAEGVETEQQRHAVADMGCELAQGFYFGRPMPGADVMARLSNGSGGPPNLPILTMS
jgi:diguanylate cyclase (GGDEF)-like protein